MRISEKIYRLRTENDLTQVQFGKIAGISDKAVSTWERGEKEPRMKPLQRICAHFDIDLNQFADVETDVYRKEKPTTVPDDGLPPLESLSNAEKQLIRALCQLNPEQSQRVLDFVQGMLSAR